VTSRVALVTGAASGIGAATASLLAQEGWRVVAVDRVSRPAPAGGRWLVVDLRDAAAAQGIVPTLETDEGRLDLLVNNAAIQIARPIQEVTDAAWDELVAVNLRAPFLLVREACHLLARASGAVVNVSSVHAIATSAGVAAYAASKGGLLALTRALAVELGPRGIRVNAVLPGAVDTPMLAAGLAHKTLIDGSPGERRSRLARLTAAGRVGTPEEIAQAVLFLADPERSGFVTGQGLVVDGGATARLSTE